MTMFNLGDSSSRRPSAPRGFRVGRFGGLAILILFSVICSTMTSASASGAPSAPPSFPDLCSFDWHAVLSVNGTRDNVAFGPEPAEEWSSYTRQQFRYLLPDHDVWDSVLEVGLGATTYTDLGIAKNFYVYTSYCCQVFSTWPSQGANCETWFSCNILALGYRNDACILSSLAPWVYAGTATVNGTDCNVWNQSKAGIPGVMQEFYASIADGTPILYHWSSDKIIGVEEFEEWLFFDQFERESQPLPMSTFDIGQLCPECLPEPSHECFAY